MDDRKKEIIKRSIATMILLIIIGIVMSVVIRYQVKGEDNMPFEISKILVVSTAEGQQKESNEENSKWNMIINQNNDIYFSIIKNERNNKVSIINYLKFENINITKTPKKGIIKTFMPNSKEGRKFTYDDEFIVNDSLTYKGDIETSEKNLTIGNQGGTVPIRISNCNLGEYVSNEDAQIVHDGTLIKTANISLEEIEFSVNLDLIINIDGIDYKANINLDLPYENILEKGITSLEMDTSNIIFKRI